MDAKLSCPACGAPSTVTDLGRGSTSVDTVVVTCVTHHAFVGRRDLLAPKLRWDLPNERVTSREANRSTSELCLVPVRRR